MDDAHGDAGEEGAPTAPEPGHPHEGEGPGMPEGGPGRAAMDVTPPIGTEDQGKPPRTAPEGDES